MAKRCPHDKDPFGCDFCLRALIRRGGLANIVCAFCEGVGHTARYCHSNRIGRARMHGGYSKLLRAPEPAE